MTLPKIWILILTKLRRSRTQAEGLAVAVDKPNPEEDTKANLEDSELQRAIEDSVVPQERPAVSQSCLSRLECVAY